MQLIDQVVEQWFGSNFSVTNESDRCRSPSRGALATGSRNSSDIDLDDGSMLYLGKKISEHKHVMLRMHVPILVP